VNADVAERVALDDEPECEGFERVDRGDVRYKLGSDALPWSNGVAYARWRPEEVEQRAKEVIAVFRERGVAFTWQIGPNTDAVGLSRVLAAQGLRREIDALLLTATIPIRGRLPEHDLRLVEELDERTATDAIRVVRDRTADEVRTRLEARMRYLRCPSRRGGGVVAYRRDLPVGHGAWRYGTDGETVYLHMASTLQPHRRTGVYTAILGWRLDRAVRDGKTTAVVVAERASTAPILMRKGFREVGAVQIWMAV
jgi:GNAT superfamily N-acetyltransferase